MHMRWTLLLALAAVLANCADFPDRDNPAQLGEGGAPGMGGGPGAGGNASGAGGSPGAGGAPGEGGAPALPDGGPTDALGGDAGAVDPGPDLDHPDIRYACERLSERVYNRCGIEIAVEDCPFRWPPQNVSGCIDGEMDKSICDGGPVEVPPKPFCLPVEPYDGLTLSDVACMHVDVACGHEFQRDGCPWRACVPSRWLDCLYLWQCDDSTSASSPCSCAE